MPSYDYKCPDCQTRDTLVTSIDRQLSIPKCPQCQNEMKRDYAGFTIQFKGTGFYLNGD